MGCDTEHGSGLGRGALGGGTDVRLARTTSAGSASADEVWLTVRFPAPTTTSSPAVALLMVKTPVDATGCGPGTAALARRRLRRDE
jgi:hypothetical protein